MEVLYLGGGCFWCVEAVYQSVKGVISVQSGYMGGTIKNPCYREICTGSTGHAEVVKVTYDASEIATEDLLAIFWRVHDPTTLNRQGADVGTQYRSVIFYTTENQRILSIASKDTVGNIWWDGKIVTEIVPAQEFYLAEEYHQNYYRTHPDQPYCAYTIPPKLKKLNEHFAHLKK